MKIGARAHDFGKLSAENLAQRVKTAGFDSVQLALPKAIEGIERVLDVTDSQLEGIREAFDKHKLEIHVYGCYVEPSLLDKEKRLEEVKKFCMGLTHAKKLGVPIVGTETTNFPIGGEGREQVYALLKDSVLHMVECAERENVTIGIEPVADHTLNSPELAKRLIDEVGSTKLKIIFDPVNMLYHKEQNQNETYEQYLKILGSYIVAMHIKDIVFEDGNKVWRNIGEGFVDYTSIIPWLKANKPQIHLLREHVKLDSYGKDVDMMRRWLL